MRPPAPDDAGAALVAQEIGELVFAREVPPTTSVFDCLRFAWQEAQSKARRTYEHCAGRVARTHTWSTVPPRTEPMRPKTRWHTCSLGPL
jgi:hypothetical protein